MTDKEWKNLKPGEIIYNTNLIINRMNESGMSQVVQVQENRVEVEWVYTMGSNKGKIGRSWLFISTLRESCRRESEVQECKYNILGESVS
jgi:hypothetical protein